MSQDHAQNLHMYTQSVYSTIDVNYHMMREVLLSYGICRFYGVVVSTADFESADPGSNPGRTFFYI